MEIEKSKQPRYEVGQKVKLVEFKNGEFGSINFTSTMMDLIRPTCIITEILLYNKYYNGISYRVASTENTNGESWVWPEERICRLDYSIVIQEFKSKLEQITTNFLRYG